mmetsp:Transcript_17039/g.66398  ORF Transcript_17039/g.66398 Transcript_17039/m.66398 type:complete len:362 (+) Transcript_17039:103-1188(+)|eukprot:CAMPEP_0114613488 /NCGR_PEP_ID=MMETSP0168-20121206/5157_1 /TAXON_ID=95228 ORGANISM="Vannella sp., Strain DIVA3 517/6/12" /NCGR_SAMPLE_ID=MMETSP0168 /ASSEMBLY_ACC=CAM_ASM_000044 /LENGTH=361 /DNA_ID=CAMNT_0001824493 /DNA_START=98 /DNA_END=1183 /DNA_ORIENTATION=-
MSAPQLVITEQSSLVLEKIGKNGEHKCVHVVVKNTPFQIDLAFANVGPAEAATFNFARINVEAQLVYDCPEEKQVDFVRHTPIEYKAHIDETGTRLSVEMRIKVLTSQLEDMLFKMKLRGVDAVTKQDIPGLYAVTEPIKVVSKQDQVKRIRRQQEAAKNGEKVTAAAPTRTSGRKRTTTDRLQETLARIEARQEQQETLLRKLAGGASEDVHMADVTVPGVETTKSKAFDGPSSPGSRFVESFTQFLEAYNELEPSQRPVKIRKLVRGSPARTTETLSKVVDQLQYELRQDVRAAAEPFPAGVVFSAEAASSGEEKIDVEKIDDFYKQFLTLPEMDGSAFAAPLDATAFQGLKETSSLFG